MIALVKERLGYEDFQENYWPGEVYLDSDQTWWAVNDAGKQSILTGLYSSFLGATKGHLDEAKAKGIPMNYKGEGLKRGGVMVVGPGADDHDVGSSSMGVLFHHTELHLGERPTNAEVMSAVERIRAALEKPKEKVTLV